MPPSPTPSPHFQPSHSPPGPPGYQQSHWDPWVIALVGACCTIFLLFSYNRLLRRRCCVSNPRNGDQTRHLNDNHHHPNDPSPQFQIQGLDSYITRSLPIVQFKKKKNAERSGTTQRNTDCAVCLGEFEEGEWLKQLPNCGHDFHVSCIDTWFQTRSSCPLCRSHVFNLEYSVSMLDMRETLSREDLRRERSAIYQALRSQILYSAYRVEPENAS